MKAIVSTERLKEVILKFLKRSLMFVQHDAIRYRRKTM